MSYISVKIHADEIHDIIQTALLDYVIEPDVDSKIEEAVNDADIVSEKDIDAKIKEAIAEAMQQFTKGNTP